MAFASFSFFIFLLALFHSLFVFCLHSPSLSVSRPLSRSLLLFISFSPTSLCLMVSLSLSLSVSSPSQSMFSFSVSSLCFLLAFSLPLYFSIFFIGSSLFCILLVSCSSFAFSWRRCVSVNEGGGWASMEENDRISAPPSRFFLLSKVESVCTIIMGNEKLVFHRVPFIEQH